MWPPPRSTSVKIVLRPDAYFGQRRARLAGYGRAGSRQTTCVAYVLLASGYARLLLLDALTMPRLLWHRTTRRATRWPNLLRAANRAGLEYVQRWAGITRTGYHGTRREGQDAGRFKEAELIVTSWLQGTSRDGDPQDHVHNQIARLVRTVRDGKHRPLDTICLRQVLGAVQAVVATHAECGLTREFGVAWVQVGLTEYTARWLAANAARPD